MRPRAASRAESEELFGAGRERAVERMFDRAANRVAYRYLPDSLRLLPAPDRLAEQLAAAGFEEVEHRLLSAGVAQLLTATRRR